MTDTYNQLWANYTSGIPIFPNNSPSAVPAANVVGSLTSATLPIGNLQSGALPSGVSVSSTNIGANQIIAAQLPSSIPASQLNGMPNSSGTPSMQVPVACLSGNSTGSTWPAGVGVPQSVISPPIVGGSTFNSSIMVDNQNQVDLQVLSGPNSSITATVTSLALGVSSTGGKPVPCFVNISAPAFSIGGTSQVALTIFNGSSTFAFSHPPINASPSIGSMAPTIGSGIIWDNNGNIFPIFATLLGLPNATNYMYVLYLGNTVNSQVIGGISPWQAGTSWKGFNLNLHYLASQ